MLRLIRKLTDTLIEQTKTTPQETLGFKMNKQMGTFFSPSINVAEEWKRLLLVTSFETMNSVFNKVIESNSFLISTSRYWTQEGGEELINKLNKLLELRSQNDIEFHVKEVGKRSTGIEIKNSGYVSAGFDNFKCEILAELKRIKYKNFQDMVYRMELTYD